MHVVNAGAAAIPALGLGTWQAKGDACQRACEHALSVGYRHIDTAQLYRTETPVGEALRQSPVPRDEVFVTTKVWRDVLEPMAATTSIENSLRALGTHIDLLLVHWPDPAVPLQATLDAMARFVDRGEVRHLGVSNFPSALVRRAAAHAPIVCNQVEYHPYLAQTAVLQTCRELGIAVAAYCPLAQGQVVDDPVLTEIGQTHGKTAAQVALAWLVQQPGVVALPKSTNPGRIEQNADLGGMVLSPEQMERIGTLARGLRLVDPPRFAIPWDA
ncbi:MAG: aldo/keto reductase [Myxococcales bacterium]|nr:aldo/keto reductase [Myxococcales bacterium]